MKLALSLHALWIMHQLQTAGYEVFLVGGAVRDIMIGQQAYPYAPAITKHPLLFDYDFATNATPDQIQAVFPDSFYENQFGTVSLTFDHVNTILGEPLTAAELAKLQPVPDPRPRIIDVAKATKLHTSLQSEPLPEIDAAHPLVPSFQITTYRTDELYDNHRQPSSMTWGKTLVEDLERRDFTINALALSVTAEQLSQLFSGQPPATALMEVEAMLLDYHHGQADLKTGTIRTVGDPQRRFQEDALRMLRAIRFSVQLNCEIESQTYEHLSQQATLLQHISQERIRDEFLKMLASPFPAEAVELLADTGLLEFVLPELLAAQGVQQGGHHTTDVWVHSLDALRCCPSPDPIVRLATLLHDISKPETQGRSGSQITFYNHEVVGARVAKKVGQRLRLARHDIDRLFILVRYHMFHYQPENSDAAIRRLMRQVGLEHLDDLLDLREADRLGSGAKKTSWRLEELKARMIAQLHQPMDVTDLAIDGTVLMNEAGFKPSRELGEALKYLLELVLDQPDLNTKDTLLAKAREWRQHLHHDSNLASTT